MLASQKVVSLSEPDVATQFAIFGEQGPDPASGAVVRIGLDGSSEPLIEGLPFVTAIDVEEDGDAYVAVGGVGPPGSGSVMKFAGLASVGSQDLARTGAETTLLVVAALTAISAGCLLIRFRPNAT